MGLKNFISYCMAANLIWVFSCTSKSNKNPQESISSSAVTLSSLSISCESNCENPFDTTSVEFVILHEDDATMFAEISRIIDGFGKYFIVDSYDSRRVVSFDHTGRPITSYGKRGNGKGEYVFPWDVDVSEDYVYIFDGSQRNLLRYIHDGTFVDSRKVPFRANGFTLLDNGKILFNLRSTKDQRYQLCITDMDLNPEQYMLAYPDGYVGGWRTADIFLKNYAGINYYSSPADTLYRLGGDGSIIEKQVLKLEKGSLDETVKLDYTQFDMSKGMQMLNNTFDLPNGLRCTTVTDYNDNRATYVLSMNPSENACYAVKYGGKMSVYDAIEPSAISQDNRLISYLDKQLAEDCHNYNALPDSLVQAMDSGNRVLVLLKPSLPK